MRFFVIPLLLAAAASAEVFNFVGQQGQSSVYGVRGAVTVGAQQLTDEKTALEYTGNLALEKVREGEYLAKFTQFSLGKYDKINRNINDETFGNLKPEEQRLVKALREQGVYEHEMQKPVKFHMQEGKVVRIEADKDHSQWSLNIYRGIFTLLQNQVRKPATLAVPAIEYKYEDGITGNCKVQYEILSQPDAYYGSATGEVYNMTKTIDYNDCISRPVYRHLKDVHRGCAGVCDNNKPENFLGQYEEEQTDFELKPTPGCPVNQQRHNSLVTVSTVAKYNVTGGHLEEARTQSTDLYRLFGGEIQVFTHLQLRLRNAHGVSKIEEPKNTQTYSTLQQRLPIQEEEELDIPIYALMKEHSKHQKQEYPEYFQKHFDAVVRELRQIEQHQQQGHQGQQEKQAFDTPAYMVELIQAVSGMTEQELKQTIPQAVRQQRPQHQTEEDQLRRQLWIELIGKAGSKSAVKVAIELIKNKTLTHAETRRVLQDIAGFQSYPDTDMIEQVLGLCTRENQGLSTSGKTTACVAAGKIISKGCNSKVFQWGQKQQQQQKQQSFNGKYQSIGASWEQFGSDQYEMSMGKLAIKSQLRCTPEKLQQYVQRLSQALRHATDFKQVVAYINGLSKIQKPEVLPELIGYVNGTAPNMKQLREQGEQQDETIEFVRRVAIMSLRDIATKYPKEVNPIVRVIFEDITEKVQTRLVAFDIWMNTQPAQWEVEKVMQVTNKDNSVELTHYVYTALKTAMEAKEPCYQLLAQRIRAAWTQIRPFDSGMKYSQFRSKSYYNLVEDFGVRGIWKVITSNTTVLPAYSQLKLEQVRGPYMKTLFGAKLLVKGGDKIWNELTGKDGLLERISHALNGQIKTGERQQHTEQLLKDIAQGMDMKNFDKETPKAVLFWKLFSGEAVIPIDAEYVKELKQELLQTVAKVGKEGVSGHFLRVLVPTKAFHVEPTTMGLPIVHSTIHPVVISVRYENVKLHYKNQQGHVLPESIEFSGRVQPTVLSFRQSRVFVAEKPGQTTPTVKVSDIKEFNLGFTFHTKFDVNQRRFKLNVKPQFERVFHSAHCTELKLEKNTIIDEQPRSKVVNYGQCIKSLYEPINLEKEIGARQLGMTLRLTGESHQPWAGLSLFGSKDAQRDGIFGALLNRLANKGMKHHAVSVYLQTNKQQPMNEWSAVIDMDSNIEALAKIPLNQQAQQIHKIKAHYKTRGQEQLGSELQHVLQKVENLLQKVSDEIQGTTIEKQLLVKLEGRYQGQPKNTIKIAMKKIYNLEKTEQQFALAAESQNSRKGIEIFANVSYPKMGSFFQFDPTHVNKDERMNGTLIAKLQGQQEQTYRVNFQAVKSDEQRQESELEWFEVRCLAEQKAGKGMTDACKKAILKDNSLDRMEMTIQLPKNVHPMAEQLAKQALTAVKYQFYPHMQTEIAGRHQQEQQRRQFGEQQEIYISANATRESQWSLLYNVRIEMPRENVTLSNIRLPGFRPTHMQLTHKQQLQHIVARGEFNDVCRLGEKAVRTYDNVTFALDVKDGCEYVLTRDQTEGSTDFTVTFKVVNQETFAKKVRVQLRNTVIELEPFTTVDRHFTVRVNGQQHQITFEKPLVFHYGQEQKRVFINAFQTSNTHHGAIVHLYTEGQELNVSFDGHSVSTIVDPRYKGRVNGICGNNDNERTHEFIGPRGHEYHQSNEFIASYGIGQSCQTPVPHTMEKMMEQLEHHLRQIREEEQGKRHLHPMMENSQTWSKEWNAEVDEWLLKNPYTYEQQEEQENARFEREQQNKEGENHVLKTAVFVEKNNICFSQEPVPACKPGFRKNGTIRTQRLQSTCLDKTNTLTQQAMQEIRKNNIFDPSQLSKDEITGSLISFARIPACVRID